MRRITVLRIVLPLLLLGFVVAIGVTLRVRPARSLVPAETSSEQGARMEGFRFSDLVGGRRRLLVQARVGRVDEQGAFTVDDVQRVEIDREGQTPLVLSAAHGAGSGGQGKRVVRLDGGVTLHDDDLGVTLVIPTVEIDQVAGLVRSLGDVRVEGDRATGRASAIVYSLRGEPAEILTLSLDGAGDQHVEAHRTLVTSGSRSATLEGAVHARQGGMDLSAERAVLEKSAAGKLERLEAGPSVTGHARAVAGGDGSFAARELRAAWDAAGQLSALTLAGQARVQHARGILAADRVDARAVAGGGATLDAGGNVSVTGELRSGPGRLSCDALTATIDAHGEIHDGVATGRARFDGDTTRGEAARIEFTALEAAGSVTLIADPERRARLADGRTRIAAERIVSDLKGAHLVAEGRVESTLLPAPGGRSDAGTPPMFAAGEAVHFVSNTLESFDGGKRLLFKGDVRGWQGERELSGDEVEMVQEGDTMFARGHVTTRLPREAGRAASDADYLQVTAEKLSYRGAEKVADYEGGVRIRQAEGWLEAPHLVALLADKNGGLKEARADGGVRFEFRSPGAQGIPKTSTGEGDRVVYETATRVVRIFGDKGPATVRGSGADASTTEGRVLRYQLDTGGLEVELGPRDRVTIKTPKS